MTDELTPEQRAAEARPCAECQQPYTPEPQNQTGFCSWACFDAKERPNAPEAFLAFLPAGTRMTRIDTTGDAR